jgi:hypothetical protein
MTRDGFIHIPNSGLCTASLAGPCVNLVQGPKHILQPSVPLAAHPIDGQLVVLIIPVPLAA